MTATSGSNAWAAGFFRNGANAQETLILHWNGSSWKQMPSASPAAGGPVPNRINGISGGSCQTPWAVGFFTMSTNHHQVLADLC